MVPTTGRLLKFTVVGTSPGSTVVARLYAVAGGVPTGPALETSDPVFFSGAGTFRDFTFSPPPVLTGGVTYAVLVSPNPGQPQIAVEYRTIGLYADGDFLDNGVVVAGADLWFSVLIQP